MNQYTTLLLTFFVASEVGRDRIVVSTSRCGRDNPGSNPGHGILSLYFFLCFFIIIIFFNTRNVFK